jgi:hypothetical protein
MTATRSATEFNSSEGGNDRIDGGIDLDPVQGPGKGGPPRTAVELVLGCKQPRTATGTDIDPGSRFLSKMLNPGRSVPPCRRMFCCIGLRMDLHSASDFCTAHPSDRDRAFVVFRSGVSAPTTERVVTMTAMSDNPWTAAFCHARRRFSGTRSRSFLLLMLLLLLRWPSPSSSASPSDNNRIGHQLVVDLDTTLTVP